MAKKTPSKRVRIANPPGTSSILKPTRLKLRPTTTSAIRPASRSIARVGVTGRAVLPAIDQTFGLAETADAIGFVEEGHTRGKVIITP